MEAAKVLRQLWRHRLSVAVGMLLALMLGVVMAYKVTPGFPPQLESRQYKVGIASAEMLIDSPSSQVADLGGGQAAVDVNALTTRARLLANLMATSPLKDQIARRAGIPARSLIASVPSIGLALEPKPLDNSNTSNPRANKLKVSFNEELPIITAEAQAATPQTAARISGAAVDQLGAYLKSVAASDEVPNARKLVISPLGPPRSAIVIRGPRRLFAIAAFIFVFGLWCTGLVIFSRLANQWRLAAAEEDLGPDPPAVTARRQPVSYSPAAPEPSSSEAPPVRDLLQRPEPPERPQHRGMVA